MVAAIIAAAVTLVVAIVAVVAIFAVRNRTKTPYAGSKKEVRSVSNVGVPTSLSGRGHQKGAAPQVPSSQGSASTNPADGLKSRFLAMGVFAAAVFGSLTAKLWSMQILASDRYATEAEENKYTTIATPAPRGYICDADGLPIVRNRTSLTVLADPVVADDHDTIARLSAVLGIPHNVVRLRAMDTTAGAQSQRVIASDVRLRDVAFISEHSDAFPHVTIQQRTVRDYPYGALAAHAVGYTGPVTEDELKNVAEGRSLQMGDQVGKTGIEKAYESMLAGDHGQRIVVADAEGNVREVESETQPTKGSDVYLTIKAPVQLACDKALAALVAPEDGAIGSGKGVAASAVVMDVRDGGIVAMANYPTFNPESFVGGISQDTWDLFNTEESHYPLLNRAIGGTYPAASTYKAFTGLAGLEYGFADNKRTWDCGGSWDGWNTGNPQMCWERGGHGTLDFRGGIVNSCDVVFYEIAKNFFDNGVSQGGTIPDTALQDYLKRFRFGTRTGIDIDGEAEGRVPTPEWKAEHWKDAPEEGPWQGGDLTNMIIGQGDVLTTPLQLAVAYGAIATGKLMRPHLLKEVRNAQGDVAVSHKTEVIGEPEVQPAHLALVRDALRGVAIDNSGISRLFESLGIEAAAKTGTGEVAGKDDFAWFACYAPYDDPKFVVTCVVEEGGGGSETAAPLGAELLAAALAAEDGTIDTTMSAVAGSTGKTVPRKSSGSSGRTD